MWVAVVCRNVRSWLTNWIVPVQSARERTSERLLAVFTWPPA